MAWCRRWSVCTGRRRIATRLRIVWVLSREREVTPNEFAELLDASQQNVSKHLKTLSQAGVVVGRQDGSCTLHSLRDREAMNIVDAAVDFVERQLREMTAQAGLTPAAAKQAGEPSTEQTA